MKNRMSVFRYVMIAGTALCVDQGIKQCVRIHPYGETLFEAPPLFELVRYGNTGAAFSIFSGKPQLIAAASVVLLVALAVYLFRTMRLDGCGRIALALLVGGGLGNLADRIAYGEVTDYIRLRFMDFPVFNFADVLITGSVLLLALKLIIGDAGQHSGE